MGRKLGTPVPEDGWKMVIQVLGLRTRQEVAAFLSSIVPDQKKLSPHAIGWWKRKVDGEFGMHVPLKYLYALDAEFARRAETSDDGGELERNVQMFLRNTIRQNEREQNGKPTTDILPPKVREEVEVREREKFLEAIKTLDDRVLVQELQRRGWRVTLELKESV